jgi:peptidoglycan/xylan/chitin deacetylase (PgdA/CDA1 family)
MGYESIGWNVDAQDWTARTPEWMAEELLRGTRPGSIVLLHDSICRSHQPVPQYDRTAMLRALEIFLENVDGQLEFVTIPELLKRASPQRGAR